MVKVCEAADHEKRESRFVLRSVLVTSKRIEGGQIACVSPAVTVEALAVNV